MDKPRVKLLGREEIRKANPFFLCNLVARRARQLRDGNVGHSVHQAINIALREFVDGELRFETINSNAPATETNEQLVPAASAKEHVRLIEAHDEMSASADLG